MPLRHTLEFRVCYYDTDQMGTYANQRALEWFERGRTETFRAHGLSYREMESRGLRLPLREAHVEYLGRAVYDDLLEVAIVCSRPGRARLRADIQIVQAVGRQPVCQGYTVHAIVDASGRPVRPPAWFEAWLDQCEQADNT